MFFPPPGLPFSGSDTLLPLLFPGVGVEVRKERGAESLAGNRPGMEKQFAAAQG